MNTTSQEILNSLFVLFIICTIFWNILSKFNLNQSIDLSVNSEKDIIITILFYTSIFVLLIQFIQFIIEHWSHII